MVVSKDLRRNEKSRTARYRSQFLLHQRVTGSDFNPAIRVKRILAPTDLSDESREAVKYAIHLAEVFGAQLTLLHFYDERWGHASPTGGGGYESMLEE